MLELVTKHAEAMTRLREITSGCDYFTDERCLRFLCGYNMDVEAASEAIGNTVKWRIENNMDEITARCVIFSFRCIYERLILLLLNTVKKSKKTNGENW